MRRPATFALAAAVFATAAPNALADGGLLSNATAPLESTTETVSQTTAPLTGTVSHVTAPLTGTVSQVTAPVTGTVNEVTAPLTDTLAPVVDTVTTVTKPVTDAVAPAVETVETTVDPVLTPVTRTVAPVSRPAIGRVPQAPVQTPPADRQVTTVTTGAEPAPTSTDPAQPTASTGDVTTARPEAATPSPPESRVSSTSTFLRRPTPPLSAGSPLSGSPLDVQPARDTPAPAGDDRTRTRPEGTIEPAPRDLFGDIPLPRGVWNVATPLSDGLILLFALLVAIVALAVPPFARRLLPVGGGAWLAVVIAVLVPPG